MTTAQFARELGITAEHLRKVVQKNGQYYGVTPTKLPNGHLLWPRLKRPANTTLGNGGATLRLKFSAL